MARITLSTFNDFRPTINGCEESEPNLRQIITYYYAQVFSKNEAEDLAEEYLMELKKKVNEVASG